MTSRLPRTGFTATQAAAVATELGIDFEVVPFDLEEFRHGLEVELEHGLKHPDLNVTEDDPLITGKIAWAHLREMPDYYTRLGVMERSAGHLIVV
jgi:uncharacterized protein DUF5661